jgi:hypothetical protein
MAHRKDAARDLARQLRREGLSLRQIANRVDAALSSVSVWVRDIPPAKSAAGSPPSRGSRAVPVELDLGRRRCGRCKRSRPLSAFNRHSTGYQWWCRDCYRAYFRDRGQLHRDQTHAARQQRRKRARQFVNDCLATHPCCDCGASDPMVLEFDHLRAKRGHIALLVSEGASLKQLRAETSKCEVVCVNCHRIRTATRCESWRMDPAKLDHDPGCTPCERRNMLHVRELLASSCCADCGDARLAVLEFDHIGAKRGTVIALARRGCSLGVLQSEIAECEIRCGNCHRRRTLTLLELQPMAARGER